MATLVKIADGTNLKYSASSGNSTVTTLNKDVDDGEGTGGTPDVKWEDVAFIENAKTIYTHGKFYDCNAADWNKIPNRPSYVSEPKILRTIKFSQLDNYNNRDACNTYNVVDNSNRSVGILNVYMDSMNHCVHQEFKTNYIGTPDSSNRVSLDGSSHQDGIVMTYIRLYPYGGTLSTSEFPLNKWTKWIPVDMYDITHPYKTNVLSVSAEQGSGSDTNVYIGAIVKSNACISNNIYSTTSSIIPVATSTKNGVMSNSDKSALDTLKGALTSVSGGTGISVGSKLLPTGAVGGSQTISINETYRNAINNSKAVTDRLNNTFKIGYDANNTSSTPSNNYCVIPWVAGSYNTTNKTLSLNLAELKFTEGKGTVFVKATNTTYNCYSEGIYSNGTKTGVGFFFSRFLKVVNNNMTYEYFSFTVPVADYTSNVSKSYNSSAQKIIQCITTDNSSVIRTDVAKSYKMAAGSSLHCPSIYEE